MSKDEMIQARELIKQKRFDEARVLLRNTSHHQAEDWLRKLDEIDPPAVKEPEPKPELDPEQEAELTESEVDQIATVIEPSPPTGAEPVESTKSESSPEPAAETVSPVEQVPVRKPADKSGGEGKIPLPIAIGIIAVVIIIGLCIIAGIYLVTTGDFSIGSVGGGENNTAGSTVDGSSLSYGQSINGVLTEANNFENTYHFQANEGDQVQITMRSDTADSFLTLYSEDGDLLAEDDDSAGGDRVQDAQINYTIRSDGEYVIIAELWIDLENSAYTLTLEQQ